MGVIRGGAPSKALDIAVILGVLHAGREAGTHSVLDPRAQATLAALEDLFDAEYPINAKRSHDQGPAMGRYAKDGYYGGNPWYLATLAAAEFCFKLAIVLRSGGEIATTDDNARFRERLTGESPTKAAFERGERFMRTVRAYTPPTGDLSEQFDHTTGAQTSAKRLAWSYAALITAAASRRQAGQAIRD
jgi:glucoamylase